MAGRSLRVGLMGFGRTGRQFFDAASRSDDMEVVAVADIGDKDVLHALLCAEVDDPSRHRLEGNFLVSDGGRARLMCIDRPAEMPWDVFEVDMVVDATGVYRSAGQLQAHLDNGAPRVLMRTLPVDDIDRIVVPGINDYTAEAGDRLISAGSATFTALALLLDVVSQKFDIECGSMTTVHAYSSDQALQDYAVGDVRRSRSAAINIVPNQHEAGRWIGRVLPAFEDLIISSALNVPIHEGCLLDTSLMMVEESVKAEDINELFRGVCANYPGIIDVVEDPVVSSDIIGNRHSLVFDLKGTIKAGKNTIKTLGWYDENRGHAARMVDVVRLYGRIDQQREVA